MGDGGLLVLGEEKDSVYTPFYTITQSLSNYFGAQSLSYASLIDNAYAFLRATADAERFGARLPHLGARNKDRLAQAGKLSQESSCEDLGPMALV